MFVIHRNSGFIFDITVSMFVMSTAHLMDSSFLSQLH